MIILNKTKYFIFIVLMSSFVFSFIAVPVFAFAQDYTNPNLPFGVNPNAQPLRSPYDTDFGPNARPLPPGTNYNQNIYNNAFAPPPPQYSQCSPTIDNIGDLLCKFSEILNAVLPVLIALGVVYLVWGVVQYFIKDDEEAKKKGRDRIIYGIIGLTVIIGLWGLVYILVNTFGLKQNLTYQDLSTVLVREDSPSQSNASALCSLKTNPKFQNLLSYVSCIINKSVIPLIFALALAMFVWGVVQFVINSDEEAKKQKANNL